MSQSPSSKRPPATVLLGTREPHSVLLSTAPPEARWQGRAGSLPTWCLSTAGSPWRWCLARLRRMRPLRPAPGPRELTPRALGPPAAVSSAAPCPAHSSCFGMWRHPREESLSCLLSGPPAWPPSSSGQRAGLAGFRDAAGRTAVSACWALVGLSRAGAVSGSPWPVLCPTACLPWASL